MRKIFITTLCVVHLLCFTPALKANSPDCLDISVRFAGAVTIAAFVGNVLPIFFLLVPLSCFQRQDPVCCPASVKNTNITSPDCQPLALNEQICPSGEVLYCVDEGEIQNAKEQRNLEITKVSSFFNTVFSVFLHPTLAVTTVRWLAPIQNHQVYVRNLED